MAALQFNLKVFGDKELIRAMKKLSAEVQNRVMRTATRKSAGRLLNQVLINASGVVVGERTGRMVAAFEAQGPRTKKLPSGDIAAFIKLPTREQLGIPRYAKDTEYYPNIVEFGSPTQPPRPFIRKAVNDNEDREIRLMGQDLKARAEAAWARANR